MLHFPVPKAGFVPVGKLTYGPTHSYSGWSEYVSIGRGLTRSQIAIKMDGYGSLRLGDTLTAVLN